jgi:ectoine hydroxylase-related dioxygenase (phytanoyl-CoA dioxygenase family)
MDVSNYNSSPNVDPIIQDLERYDLFKNVVELEAYGVTVVPPEKVATSPDFAPRLRDAIIAAFEKRGGGAVGDFRTANDLPQTGKSWDLLEEDDVFVEAATNPVVLALVRWLCGQSAIFGGDTWLLKGQGGGGLFLHSDSHGLPPGSGQIAHMCNASWILTDYDSKDDGPTVFVPGSHKYGRGVLEHERDIENSPFKPVPLIAKAGSLAIWSGATWHGSIPRTNSGLRITLVQNYFRTYMRVMREYEGQLSPQFLQKFPELERLIGKPLLPFADPREVDIERVLPAMFAGTDPYA